MHLTLGVTAHVDAGKTTLCEQLLRHAGVLRRCGRVDHGDSFMDDHALERARGITIFCEQADFTLPRDGGEPLRVTLMDTPGHVDFAGEMERALSVLDAALLVVSCAEGVQSHTATLFRMLRARRVPTIIVLSKTDREGADIPRAMAQLTRILSPDCVFMQPQDDAGREALREELAARDEALLERHFSGEAAQGDYLAAARRAFAAGELWPVVACSALTDTGVDGVLSAIAALCETDYAAHADEPFCARVYRVRREGGTRYCYVKALRGALSARDEVDTPDGRQKVNALCAAQGARLTPMTRLEAGQTAALAGLSCRPGDVIGAGAGRHAQELTPVMSVQVVPEGALTVQTLLMHLRELEEEDPLLAVRAQGDGLCVGIMGAVQIEVLGGVLQSRFGDSVRFLAPAVMYRETVAAPVVGIGHYEPLRHYAEVWLRLSPGEPGSGVTFESRVAPNSLEENWQRLIRQHVFEREHPGALTGSPMTDVRVTLLAGRSHLKHTEGGDFREATCRAIRNALMQAQSVLLEPYVRFELAMPQEALARVTGELLALGAQLDAPGFDADEATLSGVCTAADFWDYPTRFAATTRGHGRLSTRFDRYAPCRNQEEAVAARGYNPLADTENPPGSVFCSHGAGFYVAWEHVREWAHCEVEGV